jgi:pimeloyl-ACP methyl ester carboxylesterase
MAKRISAPFSAALVAAALIGVALPAQSGAKAAEQLYAQNAARPPAAPRKNPQPQMQGPPQVYFLRGLMNVFSLGMDDFARKLQANGIAATVANHADSDFVASRIVSTYNFGDHGPIVLVGHSLGADAVADIANTLARYNIPVALLVLFDGTDGHQIPGNVATAINYTRHFMISAAPGSRTAIQNVDLSGDPGIDHLNIDTAPSLQAQTMNYIMQAMSPSPQPAMRRQ